MPLYEDKCRGCGRQFEALVRGGPAPPCPSCRSWKHQAKQTRDEQVAKLEDAHHHRHEH